MKLINIKSISILSIIFFLCALGDPSQLFAEDKGIEAHKGTIYAVEFSDDENFIVTASRKIVKVWDINTGNLLKTLPKQKHRITCIAIKPDNNYLAVGCNRANARHGTVYIWDLQSGTYITKLKYPRFGSYVTCIEFSPDGEKLVVGAEHKIYLYETNNWSYLGKILFTRIGGILFSPDSSKFIVRKHNGDIGIFDTEKIEKILEVKKAHAYAVTWVDNSDVIIFKDFGQEAHLRKLNSEDILLRVPFGIYEGEEVEAKMDHLGNILVYGSESEKTLNFFDIKENKNIGATGFRILLAASISKKGKYFAIGQVNGVVFIWDLEMRRK
jgi:WD40 repeat protein